MKVYKNLSENIEDSRRVLQEIAILRQLTEIGHDNIVRLLDVIVPDKAKCSDEVAVVLEYMPMTLESFMQTKLYSIGDEQILSIAY